MQKWADEVGDESYTWQNFLPFLAKSVDYSPPDFPYQNSTNNHDDGPFNRPPQGPLQVSFGRYEDPFGTWVQRAFQAIGQAAINGFQSGKLIGSSYIPFTKTQSQDFGQVHTRASCSIPLRRARTQVLLFTITP